MAEKKKKVYKPLVIVMYIFDVKTDKQEQKITRTIDSAERREWMLKTVMWATMNGKYINIINESEDKE